MARPYSARQSRDREEAHCHQPGNSNGVGDDGEWHEQDADQSENEPDANEQERRERHDLAEHAEPKRSAKAVLHCLNDAIEVRLGEDHYTESDDDEDREPTEHELHRLPCGEWGALGSASGFGGHPTQRAHLSLHAAAVQNNAPTDGEGVARDHTAAVDDDVTIEHVRAAVDSTEHVEGSRGDRDRTTDRCTGWHRTRSEGEAVGRRDVAVLGALPQALDLPSQLVGRATGSCRRSRRRIAARHALRARALSKREEGERGHTKASRHVSERDHLRTVCGSKRERGREDRR